MHCYYQVCIKLWHFVVFLTILTSHNAPHNGYIFGAKLWQLWNAVSHHVTTSQFVDIELWQLSILHIVQFLYEKFATFVTAWLFKCNWIDLWSMGVLRFFWIWTANHIAGLNYSSANGLIHPDYGRQFQAMAEFGSGRFLTTLAVQPSASTCPCTKANGKKAR